MGNSGHLSRRRFLTLTAEAAASVAAVSLLAEGCRPEVPVERDETTVAIVGSGFGGSVAALRLGEVGIRTVVLERGRSWTDVANMPLISQFGDPSTVWLRPSGPLDGLPGTTGLLETFPGQSVTAMAGAGVGGGSLVFGGVLLQPGRELFSQVLPFLSYDEMDAVHYPRVLERVSGGPIPDDVLASPNYTAQRVFIEDAESSGMEVVRNHVAFDWDVIRKEVSGELPPAASVGEYVFGCNSGAKNSLDKNYLQDAVDTGAVTISPLHDVISLRRADDGRFEVVSDVLSEDGSILGQRILRATYVMLAAGSLNTTKLLLASKHRGELTGLNDEVGLHWGTNGGELMVMTGIDESLGGLQGGPPCIVARDDANPIKPVSFVHSPTALPDVARGQILEALTAPDALGRVGYDAGAGTVKGIWPESENATSRQARLHSFDAVTAAAGGERLDSPVLRNPTWHPLGGAVMGQACTLLGEVMGEPNLFVVDGALIPGSTGGANPSLTIAANAERIMETLVPRLLDGRGE